MTREVVLVVDGIVRDVVVDLTARLAVERGVVATAGLTERRVIVAARLAERRVVVAAGLAERRVVVTTGLVQTALVQGLGYLIRGPPPSRTG